MTAGHFHGIWSPVPFALSSMEKLPQSTGDTAILSCTVRLKPGESRTLTTALVCGHSEAFLQEAIRELRASSALDHLRNVRRLWEERLGVLQFDLPDQALTIMLNRWLRFQVHAGNMLSSSNQLTIQLPLLLTHPEEAREHILRCASDMHTPKEALLLAYVGACYVESTGDSSILQSIASGTNESLLMHCLRILDSVEYGTHDLPLTEEGSFESVCMGMFACEVIRRLAPMCGEDRQAQLNQRRELLLAAIERFAWDGAWYLRGWDQDGNRVGSAQSEENRIDLSSQSWAVICGAARERCEIAMESVWHSITVSPNQRNLNVQTVCMVISALHQLGQDERAWQLIGNLLPTTHTFSRTSAARYRAEPYLMAEELHTGIRTQNPNEWHTDGAAAFLSVAVHELLGLVKQGDELRFRPVVPAKWDLLRVTYRFGSATYHLRASRACQQPTADGKPLANGALKLVDDGRVHEAIFPLR